MLSSFCLIVLCLYLISRFIFQSKCLKFWSCKYLSSERAVLANNATLCCLVSSRIPLHLDVRVWTPRVKSAFQKDRYHKTTHRKEGSTLSILHNLSQSCIIDCLHIKGLCKVSDTWRTGESMMISPRFFPVPMFRSDAAFHTVNQDMVRPTVAYPDQGYRDAEN
jgi:hypothetical protein